VISPCMLRKTERAQRSAHVTATTTQAYRRNWILVKPVSVTDFRGSRSRNFTWLVNIAALLVAQELPALALPSA
jgi:hypothetical protein